MEFLLNAVWIVGSLLLIGSKFHSMRRQNNRVEWRVLIALGVLLALMLPVISITDDLMANNATADVEHMFRRPLEPVPQSPFLAVLEIVTSAALLLFGLRQRALLQTMSRSDSSLVRLRQGLMRLSSVRPPPCASLRLA